MEVDFGKKDYVFASSRVRSVEKYLLSRDKVEAMMDSKTPEDALKILYDVGYGDGSDTLPPSQFETLLKEEIRKVYSFVRGIAPDEAELYPFLYPYDYHNLKVLLKAEFLNIDPQPFLVDTGTVPAARMTVLVRERNFVGLTDKMRNGILEVVDVYSRTKDPQLIDFILDKACYEEMLESAKAGGSQFIVDYVRLQIDIINLKTFVRCRQMGKSWDFFSQVFIDGGRIQEKLFTGSHDEPYEQFAEKLIPYGLAVPMSEGGAMLRETGGFTALERLCDNRLVEFTRAAKHVTFGVEPLAAYLIAKEAEIRTVRIIMTGLLQNLSREEMAQRVRETYA
ncbi:MAG: V-type ATP synthase subunit C [Bacillota bacterium]|nr:V-type ATP synthase subunit C [Bacillota bacterium]NLM08381.1 V-type ATP synthase subunit C [Clostridiales Family XIII bacterium]